jgi:hypothetical protein
MGALSRRNVSVNEQVDHAQRLSTQNRCEQENQNSIRELASRQRLVGMGPHWRNSRDSNGLGMASGGRRRQRLTTAWGRPQSAFR